MSSDLCRPVLELRGIRRAFDSFSLENIDLDLYPGEVHVLVGENGAGKSTLMKLIGGWFPADGGRMYYKGQEVRFSSIHQARNAGIHYLHQDVQSFDNLSVAENLFFNQLPGSRIFKPLFDPDMVRFRCSKVFSELGIGIDPDTMMQSLGYAERQLIAAVKGYIAPSEVLIFDEPSSAMSEPDRSILFAIVEELKRRNTAIFYISHRMDEIHQVGDRVSVLSRGRIAETADCSRVNRDSLVRMMTGEVHKERFPRIPGAAGKRVFEVQGLSHPPILKDVSFFLRQGEILGITGLMGSGRTLLAHCLFGGADIGSGQILANGRQLFLRHPVDAIEAGISLIPEDRVTNGIFLRHDLIQNMTSATLRRFLMNHALDERAMSEVSHEYVEELSIKPGHSGDILETYSGGNQQKVLLSRWLMSRAMIYIMDEPTRGIDAASRVDIYNTMNDAVSRGAAIILFSSDIEEILGMSDRILILAGGRISAELDRSSATKEKILEYATDEG